MKKLETEYEGSALDSIEHKLYDPKNKMEASTPHHVRDRKATELPTSWGDNTPIIIEAEQEKGVSFGAKLLILSILILFATLGFFAWKVISLRNVVSNANIDMSADITPYVEGGESTPVKFTLFNRNVSPLQEATLTLIYEQGTGSQDEQAKVHEKRELGIINPSEYKNQDYTIVLYGSEAESRNLTFKLEYKVAGSNAIFSKNINVSTVLKTPPISVKIEGPKIISISQMGTFTITVKNNSATTSLPSVLQVTLPNTFTVQSSDPKPDSRSTVWSVPPIKSGGAATFTVTGSLTGTTGETVTMKALIGSQGESKTNIGIVYSSFVSDIKLRSSPLSFTMSLDSNTGGGGEILRYGDKPFIHITYANSSNDPLQDVSIKLHITGDAPLFKLIDPKYGHYDSIQQTITWDKSNLPELAKLAPHANGQLLIIIPVVTKGTNSPVLKLSLTGEASTELTDDVVATLSKDWAVQGGVTINGKTTFKTSPFSNTGPIPPIANKDTTYTAHINVSAQNALVNTKVSFILPSYVTWGALTSNNSAITYDTKTRTVTWSIGNIAADTTVSADINLSVRPSQSHVGIMPPITSGIVLDTDEEVSQNHIRTTISPLTTNLYGEDWGGVKASEVTDGQ